MRFAWAVHVGMLFGIFVEVRRIGGLFAFV
jgi:hypothetical protein